MTDAYGPGGTFYSEPRPSTEPRSGLVYVLAALVLVGVVVLVVLRR